jgi:protein O-mannosyl-transferase
MDQIAGIDARPYHARLMGFNSGTARVHPSFPRGGACFLLPVAAILACYAVVMTAGFVWDDYDLIVSSSLVTQHDPPSAHFGRPFSTDGLVEARSFYRPLVTLSYAFDHWVWGNWAGGYHLTNLLLHVICTLLLIAACLRAGATRPVACLLATLFALSPRLSESVAWISGRTDIAAGIGVLAAFMLFETGQRAWWRRCLAGVVLLAGLMCKEAALSGAVGISLYAWFRSSKPRSLRRTGLELLPILASVAAYALLRNRVLANQTDNGLVPERDAMAVLVLATDAVARYAGMLLDPWQPRLQIGNSARPQVVMSLLGIAAIITTFAVIWSQRRRISAIQWFGLGMGLTAVVLVSHLIRFHVNIIAADRFLYLPIAALAIALAGPIDRLWQSHHRAVTIGLLALVGSFGVSSALRARVWSNEMVLWNEAVAQALPDEILPGVELSMALMRRGRYAEALKHLDSLPLDSKRMYAVNLATCLDKLGNRAVAIKTLQSALREYPSRTSARINLMLLHTRAQHFQLARTMAATLDLDLKGRPDIHALVERVTLATTELQEMPPASPDDPVALKGRRAAAFDRLGALPEAQALWSAVALDPRADDELRLRGASYVVLFGDDHLARRMLADLAEGSLARTQLPALWALLEARFDDG